MTITPLMKRSLIRFLVESFYEDQISDTWTSVSDGDAWFDVHVDSDTDPGNPTVTLYPPDETGSPQYIDAHNLTFNELIAFTEPTEYKSC